MLLEDLLFQSCPHVIHNRRGCYGCAGVWSPGFPGLPVAAARNEGLEPKSIHMLKMRVTLVVCAVVIGASACSGAPLPDNGPSSPSVPSSLSSADEVSPSPTSTSDPPPSSASGAPESLSQEEKIEQLSQYTAMLMTLGDLGNPAADWEPEELRSIGSAACGVLASGRTPRAAQEAVAELVRGRLSKSQVVDLTGVAVGVYCQDLYRR